MHVRRHISIWNEANISCFHTLGWKYWRLKKLQTYCSITCLLQDFRIMLWEQTSGIFWNENSTFQWSTWFPQELLGENSNCSGKDIESSRQSTSCASLTDIIWQKLKMLLTIIYFYQAWILWSKRSCPIPAKIVSHREMPESTMEWETIGNFHA